MVERCPDKTEAEGSIPSTPTTLREPRVIYEDADFVAIDKPAGVLVHEARSMKQKTGCASSFKLHASSSPTLVSWLVKHYPEIRNVGDDPKTRPGIVHRLDRDTSGVMLVARNQKYFEYLKSLFQKREIKKTYLALVHGKIEPRRGVIDLPIGIKSGTTKRTTFSEKLAKTAVTEYRVLTYHEARSMKHETRNTKHGTGYVPSSKFHDSGSFSLLEVTPQTGRTHQIRVHLARIGYPIVGDSLYGRKLDPQPSALGTRLMLHALSLEFTTAEGKRIKIEAELPSDFRKI